MIIENVLRIFQQNNGCNTYNNANESIICYILFSMYLSLAKDDQLKTSSYYFLDRVRFDL